MRSPSQWDGRDWSREDLDDILEKYCVDGIALKTISEIYGCGQTTIRRQMNKWGGVTRHDRGNARRYYEITGQELPEALKPRLQRTSPERTVPITRPGPVDRGSYDEVSLHWSDIHFPFHDPRATACLYAVARDVVPSTLIAQGDLIDLWQISKHRPPLETKMKPWQINVQETVDMAVEHLEIMSGLAATDDARKVYLFGNHEDRFERLLAEMQLNSKSLALMRMPKISEVLDLSYLMSLGETGWESYSYLEGDTVILHDRLLCLHGYRSSQYSAKGHLADYGKSLLFGHSHRIQNWTSRDLRGTDAAWNIGCLCDLNPHWRSRPNWHQGFAVVSWKEIAKDDWIFNLEQVRIHDGIATFRDKVYHG